MRSITQLAVKMLDRVQIRMSRARPGSVLILVVVLVLLLALIGTASLSTTQGDRYMAIQNSANTQVDLIVQGAIEMARANITGGLFGAVGSLSIEYRPPETPVLPRTDYAHWDAYNLGVANKELRRVGSTVTVETVHEHGFVAGDRVGISSPISSFNGEFVVVSVDPTHFTFTQAGISETTIRAGTSHRLVRDMWLSPRFPTAYPQNPAQPWPMWSSLGRLSGVTNFDSPLTMELRAGSLNLGISTTDLAIPTVYSDRVSYTRSGSDFLHLMPNFVMPYGTADGRAYPAFSVTDPRGLSTGRYVIAGDTDGDGVADAGLFKFPIGEVDGVTYYVAVRIIDNNSAVNVNTAWSRSADFDFTPGPNPTAKDALGNPASSTDNNLGIFPSHVGLLEMMHSPNPLPIPGGAPALAEMHALNLYRNASPQIIPTDDTGAPRTDFNWNTQGEAYAFQLARRLQNPVPTYKPFGASESAALAFRFTLQNRDASPSVLEERLSSALPPAMKDSVYRSAGNDDGISSGTQIFGSNKQYYLAGRRGIGAWFDDNFHFDGFTGSSFTLTGAGTPALTVPLIHSTNPAYKRPLRALLTTDNPVSNQITMRFPNPIGSTVLPSSASLAGSPRRLIHPNATPPYKYMTPYGINPNPKFWNPTKTNVNTANFDELWRAYWCVMMDNQTTDTPFPTENQATIYAGMNFNTTGNGGGFVSEPGESSQRMFRSSLRDPMKTGATRKYLLPKNMVLLRSAIAAVQTMQMRGQDGNDPANPLEQPVVYERLEGIPIEGGLPAGLSARITVFGTTPQPFITEVFAWRDIKTPADPAGGGDPNPVAYVAIELYNPYPFPITLTSRYKMAMVDRAASPYDGVTLEMALTPLTYNFNNRTIQPNECLVIDNYGDMLGLPSTVMDLAERNQFPDRYLSISGLHQVLEHGGGGKGGEFIIYQEIPDEDNPGVMLKKSIDSFDFYYFMDSAGGKMGAWHYSRPCGGDDRWKCVYPGRYRVLDPLAGGRQERHQGTDWKMWDPDNNTGTAVNAYIPFERPYQPTLGRPSGTAPPNFGGSGADYGATIRASLPIQLANLDFGGPNKKINSTGNKFPFGGFMRNGDILQVPYIAAYTITLHSTPADPGKLMDMNSVSMDAAFAEDSDTLDDQPNASDPGEQVGRFCPLRIGPDPTPTINDYGTDAIRHRYAWAKDLFDYLSVTTPSRDYMPEYPMQREWVDLGGQNREFSKGNLYSVFSGLDHSVYRCDASGPSSAGPIPGSGFTLLVTAKSVDNIKQGSASQVVQGISDEKENSVGVQGLININTAPWKVLAAIPWVPAGSDRFTFSEYGKTFATGGNGHDDNEDIARAIVYWRDGNALSIGDALPNGPFTSLFDLYRVRVPVSLAEPGKYVFEEVQKALATEPDDAQGDFSPQNGNPVSTDPLDHARRDFEEQFLLLTKVSNLLTTRSDSFTVYIQVQGWRGVGTLKPELVVQRRAAFIQDRSKVTRTSSSSSQTQFPND